MAAAISSSLAADWKISPNATLQLDSNYQTSAQRSVSGYQLLGGTMIPAHPSRTRMLGFQPWQQPVGIDASNSTLRFDYRFSDHWSAQLSASHSRAVIDDNVAFAYGCFYSPDCASGATPGWFFAPNGDYDIYDYRSPDDTRVNDEARAVLKGAFDTGAISHELSLGTSAFRRTIDRRPYVYDYVGTGNIDQVEPAVLRAVAEPAGPLGTPADQLAAFACSRWIACIWARNGKCWPAAASCACTSAPTTPAARPNATRA